MSIASRIEQIEEHIGDIYDTLELGGDSTQNKNIVNINSEIKREYKDFLANGTDVVWNNWSPKVTGSGETITLNNTIEAKMEFIYKGNTYQYSTTGKNLLPLNIISSQTSGSLTITNLGDGTLKLNGTNSNQYIDISYNYELQANVEYKWVNLNTLSGSDGNVSFRDNSNNSITYTGLANASNTYTPTSNKQVAKMRLFFGTTTFNNYIVKIMLIKSTDTETWEKYTGANPSPNPDYPQDIQVVSGDNTIKVEGKNLLPNEAVSDEINNLTFTKNSDGSITINGTANANTVYTLLGNSGIATEVFKINANENYYNTTGLRLVYRLVNGNYGDIQNGSFTKTTDLSIRHIYLSITSGTTFNNEKIYPQIVKGSTTSTYTPYVSQTYPINLGNIELCKIGTYQDRIYKDNGKWYLNKQIGKVVLDGTENWIRSGNTSESFFCGALAGVSIPFEAKMGTASDSKTNYFVKGNKSSNAEVFDMYNGTGYYTTFALYLRTSRATDVTTFKNWLGTHNVILYYVLSTPTTTEITDTTLISQLEAIKKSYNTQTSISQVNNDLPFILDVVALGELD